MNESNDLNDLVRFSAPRNAELMIKILEDTDIVFKLTQLYSKQATVWQWSNSAVVIQVANKDFNRAEAMLIEYQKTIGVPFS